MAQPVTPASPKTTEKDIDSILKEKRLFKPSEAFSKQAHIKSMAEYEAIYKKAEADPESFWADAAKDLHWFKPWTKVLEWNAPWAKWFVGGE